MKAEWVNGVAGACDSFRVEEAYSWRDDIMEITRRIVHDTDEARLSNIADHFEVDMSEIREYLEMKRQQKYKQNKQTNADHIRAMSDEELARFIARQRGWYAYEYDPEDEEYPKVIDWLKQEAQDD